MVPGANPIADRKDRVASTICFSVSTRAESSGKRNASLGFGNGESEIVAPLLPASGATVCHSSSVMNGMNGCARRSVASSSRTRTARVRRAAAASPVASACASSTLASSTYQSQYSFQTNS